jgi:putative transposase
MKTTRLHEEESMICPYCATTSTKERGKKTKLGYTTFFCLQCKHIFNERTGTPFNYLEFPTDIVLLVILWRLRYKLSLRDLAEMFLERGFTFTHEAVRDWEARFASLLADQLRIKRHWQAGRSWYVDETYIKGATRTWLLTLSEAKEISSLVGLRLSPKSLMATGVASG